MRGSIQLPNCTRKLQETLRNSYEDLETLGNPWKLLGTLINPPKRDSHHDSFPHPFGRSGHEESYNPPVEYVPSEEEVKGYDLMYEEDRPKFIPRQ